MTVRAWVTFLKLMAEQSSDSIFQIHATHPCLPLSDWCSLRNSVSVVMIPGENSLENAVGLLMITIELETQRITTVLRVMTVVYITGDWNSITLITKLKELDIKVREPDPSQCLPAVINLLLYSILSMPFLCITLNWQTLVMARLWGLARRPGTDCTGQEKQWGCSACFLFTVGMWSQLNCIFKHFSWWHVSKINIWTMQYTIWELRFNIRKKEIGYPDWVNFIKEIYNP